MAKITGLTFILPVRDLDRAAKFYEKAFDLKQVFRNEGRRSASSSWAPTAATLPSDCCSSPRTPALARRTSVHTWTTPSRPTTPSATSRPPAAPGRSRIVERGEHAPGVPYARIKDPDGNELWF